MVGVREDGIPRIAFGNNKREEEESVLRSPPHICTSKTISRVLYLTVIYLGASLPVRSSHPGSGRANLMLPYRCCSG